MNKHEKWIFENSLNANMDEWRQSHSSIDTEQNREIFACGFKAGYVDGAGPYIKTMCLRIEALETAIKHHKDYWHKHFYASDASIRDEILWSVLEDKE